MKKALVNVRIFTGERWLDQHALVIEDCTIVDILPQSLLAGSHLVKQDLFGDTLLPGLIDLQVNGGGGVMFNNAPTIETLRIMSAAHSRYGTTGFMPTLITTSYEIMRQAVAAVEQAIDEKVPGVLGIHLEGPFLSVEKKGAHDASKFCPIDDEGFGIMTSLKAGKTLVTIAPELADPDIIRRLVTASIIVCAGHSNADYPQTCEALKSGVTGFTHLFNAMTPLQSREPGMVGAALEDTQSWFGIIADGFHSHPASFRLAVQAKQRGGAILVSDAMATVGAKNKSFVLDGERIHAVNGRCTNAAGSLAGSDLDMLSAVNNAAKFAQLEWEEAVRMATLYPAQVLNSAKGLGEIKQGGVASFISVTSERKLKSTWINGERVYCNNEPQCGVDVI